ncbi:solute carrier family 35 member B1 [Daphnia magna]|uniref:Solute carrier family 35 member B1 n=1 Tax=Daphnia magna TaxID=35525 RepID=A0A162C9Y9_9CRUS|nr:solute carrier family 35 member B1 [Daphnia magna]KZS13272.1 Solute carrier family 35 member B1 [Daphnia magna]
MALDKRFLGYASGIFICYFYFGILQERITRGKYGEGETQEKFTYTLALVFVQCVVNFAYAKIMLSTVMKQGEDKTSRMYYASSALTYLLAMVCSNMALQWVNYPTQVVGKSCKPIPVMVLGVLFGNKSYPMAKYLFILTVVLGVAMFMYKDKPVTAKQEIDTGMGIGEILLILSLIMDGLTGAIQERMKTEYQSKSGHMMLYMNLWSVGYLAFALLVTGELFDFVGFISRHPFVLWDLTTFSIASALGQFFIFRMIADYGALPCSIVTTTRKFFTVMASVIYFGNQLSGRQWIGATLVFAGLTMDSVYGKNKAPKKS